MVVVVVSTEGRMVVAEIGELRIIDHFQDDSVIHLSQLEMLEIHYSRLSSCQTDRQILRSKSAETILPAFKQDRKTNSSLDINKRQTKHKQDVTTNKTLTKYNDKRNTDKPANTRPENLFPRTSEHIDLQ